MSDQKGEGATCGMVPKGSGLMREIVCIFILRKLVTGSTTGVKIFILWMSKTTLVDSR